MFSVWIGTVLTRWIFCFGYYAYNTTELTLGIIIPTKRQLEIFMNWLEIMSSQSPTSFGCIDIDNSPSELDVLCVNAFKAVRALNVFDDSLFEKVPSYEKKHLHTWCVEVLAADFWGFFNPDTDFNKESRPVLIDRFIQLYEIGSFLDADEEFKINLDYQ